VDPKMTLKLKNKIFYFRAVLVQKGSNRVLISYILSHLKKKKKRRKKKEKEKDQKSIFLVMLDGSLFCLWDCIYLQNYI
jgi:hypothetical protein